MTPLIHDFIIENTNTKYLIANKRYFIRSYCKILLEENSDAKIKVYDLNNTEIYTIDKNNSFLSKNNSSSFFSLFDRISVSLNPNRSLGFLGAVWQREIL